MSLLLGHSVMKAEGDRILAHVLNPTLIKGVKFFALKQSKLAKKFRKK